jgi:hypothetical protein
MSRPDAITTSVTDANTTTVTGRVSPGVLRAAPHPPLVHDAAEAAVTRKARRQGLLLMIASAVAMIALIGGILLALL